VTRRRRQEPAVEFERRGLRMAITVVATGVLVAACGRDSEPARDTAEPAADTIAIVGTDELRFDPDGFVVPADEEFTVELTAGAVEHDFTIEIAADVGQADDSMGDDDLHVVHADAGSTQTGSFTIDEPGTYTVYCSIPGHRDAGMVASLEVIAAQG
jgi:uncharacterized cupredoxin-like copper-binding protein